MESNGNEWNQLTLFAEVTRVSRSASPEQETAPTMPAIFGRNSPTLLGFYDPDTHCWKTSQGTFHLDSEMCLQTWPRAGITHNGIAYQLRPSAHRTCATEYSLSLHGKPLEWTPTATANQMAPSMQPRNPGLRLWPTPQASDAKNYKTRVRHKSNAVMLSEAIHTTSGVTGRMNPGWVEWLMGFPEGWTDLEHSETPLSHK